MPDYDVIIVGGGLSAGLLAHRVATRRPRPRQLLLEAGPELAGNHTWSYHQSDVPPARDAWLMPFVRKAWDRQVVHFERYSREQMTGYRSMASDTFRAQVHATPGLEVRTSTPVVDCTARSVTLASGETLTAPLVIDARGAASLGRLAIGYQKFLGLEIETAAPHGLEHPIIMDVRVPQIDGYRFVYCLPFSKTELLVEDTYYSDTPTLDATALTDRVHAYIAGHGWEIARVIRREIGVLPIILAGELDQIWPAPTRHLQADPEPSASNSDSSSQNCPTIGHNGPPDSRAATRIGMRAGLFHQTTGYSVPLAAAVADGIAGLTELTTEAATSWVRALSEEVWEKQRYYRMLNRTMFVAAKPHRRFKIFERFYKLSQPLIERFYAGDLTSRDKIRLLTGKPPIAMHRALLSFAPSSANPRRLTGTERSAKRAELYGGE